MATRNESASPSRIGGSGPSTSIVQSSISAPESADIRCSTTPTRRAVRAAQHGAETCLGDVGPQRRNGRRSLEIGALKHDSRTGRGGKQSQARRYARMQGYALNRNLARERMSACHYPPELACRRRNAGISNRSSSETPAKRSSGDGVCCWRGGSAVARADAARAIARVGAGELRRARAWSRRAAEALWASALPDAARPDTPRAPCAGDRTDPNRHRFGGAPPAWARFAWSRVRNGLRRSSAHRRRQARAALPSALWEAARE